MKRSPLKRKTPMRPKRRPTGEIAAAVFVPKPAPHMQGIRWNHELPEAASSQPKPKTPRSGKYLDFLRGHPCARCHIEGPSEASHHGKHGVKIKASDYQAIPLCHACHHAHHQGRFTVPAGYDSMDHFVTTQQARLLEAWHVRRDGE